MTPRLIMTLRRMAAKPMKPLFIAALFAGWMLCAAIVSLVVTGGSWGMRIEDWAYHCNDIGFGFYWTDMDAHKSAGDTIYPGWTWEKLKAVRLHYIEAFWLILGLLSAIPFLVWKALKRGLNAPQKPSSLDVASTEPANGGGGEDPALHHGWTFDHHRMRA